MTKRSKVSGSKWLLVGVSLLGITLLLFSQLVTIAPPSIYARAGLKTRLVVLALRAYADDRDGAYPTHLEDLYPDYIDDKDQFRIKDDTVVVHEMIYHPTHFEPSLSHLPVVEFPREMARKRVVGYANGSVDAMKQNNE